MELKLEVIRSVTIQRNKPGSSFAWLQIAQDQCHGSPVPNGLFLLDNTKVCQLSLDTGKTKSSFPSLSSVQSQLALTQASHSGSVLAGLTVLGDMFTWKHPLHQLVTYTTPLSSPSPHSEDLKGCHFFVSDSGEQALLVTGRLDLHLWELTDGLYSEWWELPAPDDLSLPHTATREVAIDASFYVHQILGECCECNIVYTDQETGETSIAHSLLTWKQTSPGSPSSHHHNPHTTHSVQECSGGNVSSSVHGESGDSSELLDGTNLDCTAASSARHPASPYNQPAAAGGNDAAPTTTIPVHIAWKTCSLSKSESLPPPRGRGCYVVRLCPTGRVSAVAINHTNAVDTHVLFIDLLNEVSLSVPVYIDRSDVMTGRTFWITSLAWSGDGLLLAAMTCRGSLLLMPRFGPPLKLVTNGCGLDMGPARLLPLHPLITVQNKKGLNITDHETSESSERDPLRQKFSVACHPHLPVMLCSDGYCLTVLKLPSDQYTLPRLVCSLANTYRTILGLPTIESTQTHDRGEHMEKSASMGVQKSKKVLSQELDRVHDSEDGFTTSVPAVVTDREYLDHRHNLSHTQNLSQVSGAESQQLANTHLLAAWGLLMSADVFQPGNGMYPGPLSANKVKTLSVELNIARNVTITTLVAFPRSPSRHDGRRECIKSALSMVYLDQLDQKHHKMVYKLTNAHLMSLLSQLLLEHRKFAASSNHTLQSMETYAKFITSSLQHFWKVFQNVVMLVTDLYCHSSSDSQQVFRTPLLVLKRISNVVSHDLLTCNKMAEKMLTSSLGSGGLQEREMSFLYGNTTRHINEAETILDQIGVSLTAYFNHNLSTTAVLTGLNRGMNAPSGSSVTVTSSTTLEAVTETQSTVEDSITTVTPVQDGSTLTMTTVTPDMDSTTLSGSTLHAEDLATTPSTQSAQIVLDGSPSTHLKHVYPLLHIPDDMVPVHTEEYQTTCQQSLLHAASSDSSLSQILSSTTTCTNTASDTMCTTQQVSSLQLGSGFQVDLTDSQSTGEFPSQLTFSDGEFGSGANPNSTAENQLPSQTMPLMSHDGDDAHPLLHAPHIEHTLSPPTRTLAVVVDHQICAQGRHHTGEISVGGGHKEDEEENKEGVNDGDTVNGDGEGDHKAEQNGDHGRNDEEGVDGGGNKDVVGESGRDDKERTDGRDGEHSKVELNGDDREGAVDGGVGEDVGSSRHGRQQGRRENAECGRGSDGSGSEPSLQEEEVRKSGDNEADKDNTTPSVSVQQLDPHHSHSRDLGDLRSQNMDIEGIVRSEMKKLLQAQHQQLMQMLSTSSSRTTEGQAGPPPDATSLQDITNTHAPSDQSHESTVKDSIPDRPSSSYSALSLRHLKQEDTPLPLPAQPLLNVSHGQACQATQPQGHPPHTCHATSDSDPVQYKSPLLPLLQLDTSEDHMTSQYSSPTSSQTELPCGRQPQSSPAKQSVHHIPLLTLEPPEEDLHIPQAPQLRSAHKPDHITLPLLQCQPPGHALVDIGVGQRAPSSITTQLSPCLPNIPGVTGITDHKCAPMIPLVLTEEKLPTLPPALPPPIPPPPLHPVPLPPHALIRLPTKPETVQLLPADVLSCNQPPVLHMGGHASMELLQLPEQRSETLPHVPLIHQLRSHGRTTCNRSHRKRKRQRRISSKRTSPSLPSMSDHNITSSTNTTSEHSENTPPQLHDDEPLHKHREKEEEVVCVAARASPPTCEKLEATMKAAYETNDHSEDVPKLSGNPKPQPTLTVQFPSSESEGPSLDQPSGQTDNSVQTVTSPQALPTAQLPTAQLPTAQLPTAQLPTAHSPAPAEVVGHHFIHVMDIDTDEGSSPILSGNEGSVISDKQSLQGQSGGDQESVREEGGGVSSGQGRGISEGSGPRQERETGALDDGGEHTPHIGHSPDPLIESLQVSEKCGDTAEREHGVGGRAVVRREVLSQLHHLECQLSAIENTARTVQGELLASNQLLGTIDELQTVSKTIPSVLRPASRYRGSTLLPNAASIPAAVEATQPNEASITAHLVEVSTAVLPNEAGTTQTVKAPLTTQLNETSVANEASTSAQPAKASSDSITVGMKEGGNYSHHPPCTTIASGDHPIPPTPGPGSSALSCRPAQDDATITPHAPIPTCVPDTAVWRPQPAVSGTDDGSRMTSKMHHHGHDKSSSSLLSGRCSKKTLKKWVAAKRREKITSSETVINNKAEYQMAPDSQAEHGDKEPKRSQSQEHMTRRMEDALVLMEDILSAEPHPPSYHTTARHAPQKHRGPEHSTMTGSHPAKRSRQACTSNTSHQLTGDTVTAIPSRKYASTAQPFMRYCSSVEGLTVLEQMKMAEIMASTELSSVSSGSIATHIDWELVDHLIED